MNANGYISLFDFGIAYRKAKADLFYSSRACKKALLEYESELEINLKQLKKILEVGKAPEIPTDAWTLVPKGLKIEEPESSVISSDPNHLWSCICEEAKPSVPEVEFRLMEALPIDFHVFAALWINKVGHKFEEKLNSAARGNRLRRGQSGKINPLSLGSTLPYLFPYCKWRDDAFDAMKDALNHDKSIVTITADVKSFYHKIDVRFMLHNDFLQKIGVLLNKEELRLHTIFINAIYTWAQNTPICNGLPVGLNASAVIANLALFEIDQIIKKEITPLYYGRYVDDLIIVIENGSDFKKSQDVWDWICKRTDGALSCDNNEISYNRTYLDGSEVIFENNKNKTFILSGDSGKSVLTSIRQEIQARTSEWRSLPNLPQTSIQLESMLLTAIQRDGVSADSLRKADKLSVRRAGFAIKLRDIEAYSRALPPNAWKEQRQTFINAFIQHILVLPVFFNFYTYLPRILSLTVNCGDFDYLKKILDALEQISDNLNICNNNIKAENKSNKISSQKVMNYFRANLVILIQESIESSMPMHLSREYKDLWSVNFDEKHSLYEPLPINELISVHNDYLKRDLAYRPFKQILLAPELSGLSKTPVPHKSLGNINKSSAKKILNDVILNGVNKIAEIINLPEQNKIPSGLLFPTRPLGIHDLYLLHKDPFSKTGSIDIAICLLAMRGFKPEGKLPEYINDKLSSPIHIQFKDNSREEIRIALTSWKTENDSWTAAAKQEYDPDNLRLNRLNHLLNSVIKSKQKPEYLIMPELSIPAHWFLAVAGKLQDIGVSLICGIEYQHGKGNIIHNQVWAALSHDALGFNTTMIYRQDKQRAAIHEESELNEKSGKIVVPQLKPWTTPPIINHGGFQFAILICSELTNISYRAALRGKIDALFVPEWNPDTESFNALVESAALDIHAYIIQCNDREYGDSRIRAPYKENHQRDIVRVKGGIHDYFVAGKIDILSLRQFQSNHRSPKKPYKPVPDGFKIDHSRKTLPVGDNHEK